MIKLFDITGNDFFLKNTVKKINGVKIEIKTYLDANSYAEAINTIAESCFNKEGAYRPEFREIVRRYVILKYFTNIDVDSISVNEIFKTSQNGNWFETIEKEVTSLRIWTEIEDGVDRQIEYMLMPKESAFDHMCNKVVSFLESIPTDTNTNETLKEVGTILDKLGTVDKDAFVDAVINKGGDSNGSKKS